MSDTTDKLQTPEQWEEHIAEAKARGEHFQRLHAEGVIEHEVRKAAEDAGAFNPEQILRFLKGKSRLVEAGGKHVVRVVTVGDDGKEVHHTPAQAIWHMKQNKDNFNLFRDTMTQTSTLAPQPTKPKLDFKHMTPEQYLKIRAEHPEWLGLDPSRNKRR